ncbi:MAG: U32 family peptidase [Clostridiales bacterium]|nr:U32 family peptidase [Clostridiales bacterium]
MEQKPEILSPAGERESLLAALRYGADAVYLAGRSFGMRAAAANFDKDGLWEAVELAHAAGAKAYIACNTLPRDRELESLPAFLEQVDAAGADALIVADLGVMALARRYAPRCALHVSVQLGVTNAAAAAQLYEMGAARVVLSRELSLEEIALLRDRAPKELELEAFVHGAVCLSVSGRCLLSAALTGRDANRGDCAQPCRWRYGLVEEKRPGLVFPVETAQEGSYLLDANDLCMLEHVAALAQAGIVSFKIEGRAKAPYYVAAVTNAYRMAVDGYAASGFSADYRPPDWLREETDKVSHRPYGTGFYFGMPGQNTVSGGYIRRWEVAGAVLSWEKGELTVSQRNRFFAGEELELLPPGERPFTVTAAPLSDGEGRPLSVANHPEMTVRFPCPRPVAAGTLLRRRRETGGESS